MELLRFIKPLSINIYSDLTLPSLKINSLSKMLLLCTTEVPFFDLHENICIQKDGIAIGLVLGPILRNIDDILPLTNSTNEINIIQEIFNLPKST